MDRRNRDGWRRITPGMVLVGLLLIAVLAAMPSAVASVVRDARTEDAEVLFLPDAETYRHAAVRLHLEITALTENEGLFTVQARAVPICDPCPSIRIVISYVSVRTADVFVGGRTVLTIKPDDDPPSVKIDLPAVGSAIDYPFDRWGMAIFTAATRVTEGGDDVPLTGQDVRTEVLGIVFDQPFAVSIQNRVPQLDMTRAPAQEVDENVPPELAALGLQAFDFDRPAYVKMANVLLVVLIALASIAAAFLTPERELAVNAGALVLGIWGIRAMLLGTDLDFVTVIDLALMVTIAVVLIAITARLFWRLSAPRPVPTGRGSGDTGGGDLDAEGEAPDRSRI